MAISVGIPGFGALCINILFTDYTGTLSFGGEVIPGVPNLLRGLAEKVRIIVVTSETFGTVNKELGLLPVEIQILPQGVQNHDSKKLEILQQKCSALSRVAVFGNGRNDVLVLEAVKKALGLSVAVENGEGVATEALQGSSLLIHGAVKALDLLNNPKRLKATLRR